MFESVEPLDKNKHQDLKLNPAGDFSFAQEVSSVPLSYSELVQDKQFSLGRKEEQGAVIRGFKAVDAGKLGELDDATLGGWVR